MIATIQPHLRRLETLLYALLLGGALPVFLFMLAVTLWFYLSSNEAIVLYPVIAAILTGLIIDGFFLRKCMARLYHLPIWIMVILFVFYNICIYGFFMGFPLFNLVMGPIAGYYMATRLHKQTANPERIARTAKRTVVFTGVVMLMLCTVTAILGLSESSITYQSQEMLHINTANTRIILWAISLIGGVFLVGAQVILTRAVMLKSDNSIKPA